MIWVQKWRREASRLAAPSNRPPRTVPTGRRPARTGKRGTTRPGAAWVWGPPDTEEDPMSQTLPIPLPPTRPVSEADAALRATLTELVVHLPCGGMRGPIGWIYAR